MFDWDVSNCTEGPPTNLGRAPSPKAGVVLVGSTLGGGSSEMRAVSGAVVPRVGMAPRALVVKRRHTGKVKSLSCGEK